MKSNIITLIACMALTSCSSQETIKSAEHKCGVVNFQDIVSRSNSVNIAKQKIAQTYNNRLYKLKQLRIKKQRAETTLLNDLNLSENERENLYTELENIDNEIDSINTDLEPEMRQSIKDYNRNLSEYFIKVIAAKAKRDGIDVIYNEGGDVLVKTRGIYVIDCTPIMPDYTETIIDILNR